MDALNAGNENVVPISSSEVVESAAITSASTA